MTGEVVTGEVAAGVAILRRGGLVAFPTETVYGLGADAANPAAVRRLFAVKGRPAWHPVIVHLAAAAELEQWAAEVTSAARRLAEAFWPGPLTVVLPRAAGVPDAVTGGADTVALRVPDQTLALQLLRAFGGGVAAPSANRFGRVSPTRAADVVADLGTDVDLVLDGGPCRVGVESTIVNCTAATPTILRQGAVTAEDLGSVLGEAVNVQPSGADPAVPAPGTLASHYAPAARIVLAPDADAAAALAADAASGGDRVGVLAPGDVAPLPAGLVVLEPAGDPTAYAHVLYARLREADARGLDVLVVVPPADAGVGRAVRDRLRRAAAG